jgi:hypothetical protein
MGGLLGRADTPILDKTSNVTLDESLIKSHYESTGPVFSQRQGAAK